MRKMCTANGYSNDFIRRHIRRHTQPRPMTTGDQRTATADGNPTQKWHTIPYIRTVSEGTRRMLAKYGIRVAHKPTKTLRSQLMLAKDPLKDEEKSGVVCRVNCEECSSYYVGETSKHLMTRMQERKSAVRRHDTNSHIWAQLSETGHVVDFKKAKVQVQTKSKGSRRVQEAWLSQTRSIAESNSTPPSSHCGTNCNTRTREGSPKEQQQQRQTANRAIRPRRRTPQRRAHVSGGDNKVQGTHHRGPETTDAKHGLPQTLICII